MGGKREEHEWRSLDSFCYSSSRGQVVAGSRLERGRSGERDWAGAITRYSVVNLRGTVSRSLLARA
jgi:hypothetical protein